MAEKNYTEYERDLRDFEKKPLAKDRETLIFPPESDIKGSDDHDPSVLPVAPKLSMRKEAVMDIPVKILYDVDGECYLRGSIVHDYHILAGTDGRLHSYGPNTSVVEINASVIFDANPDLKERLLSEWKMQRASEPEVNAQKEYAWWENLVESGKSINITISTDALDLIKEASKKISVNDKILTSTKKTAKIVAISDDIVFWVSIDGEKDFGSDFVDEVELFEEHEPFEEHGLRRREQGEPIEGITKDIPLEETIELANKDKRKKKAGTWSLPFTPTNALVLKNIVTALENKQMTVSAAKENLHAVYGDDELFDELDVLDASITERAAESIRSSVGVLIDDYDTDPENFEDELDPEARNVLNEIVRGE